MPKPVLNIRNVPPEIFGAMRERMRRDGWHSTQELVVALMKDFGAGRITPSDKPSPFDPTKAPAQRRPRRPLVPENRVIREGESAPRPAPDRARAECRKGHHADPDNSGMCIYCCVILDPEPDEDANSYRISKGWAPLPVASL